jgi:hypothetical protein
LYSHIDENRNNKISVYPNPASETLHLEDIPPGNIRLELYDIRGAKVFTASYNNKTSIDLNISTFAEGLYSLLLISEQGKYYSKFSHIK